MLMGIPGLLSPELLKILCEMGHGDEIVIGDGNFPAASMANHLVRCDGHGVPELLDAILKYFPLDTFTECPVTLMATAPGDKKPEIWGKYEEIIQAHDKRGAKAVQTIDRFSFYGRAKQSYAIIATGERALYACMILKKGVVPD